jgi:transcriptional regulator with XRE-family HTH domain
MAIKANKTRQTTSEERRGPFYSHRGNRALRDTAKKLGLSLQDVATAIKRKRHAVWKWFHGLSRPTREVKLRIQEEFSIPASWWLTAEEKKSKVDALRELEKVTSGKRPTKAQVRLRKVLEEETGGGDK